MKKIYETNEWKGRGSGKHYYHNEYRQEDDKVVKYQCHRGKNFDGNEREWVEDEKVVDSWDVDSPDMPDWLRNKL